MNAKQVHSILKNDEAYQYAREYNSPISMAAVLEAHGYPITRAHITAMLTVWRA